jgi:hypothetical protein
MPSGRRATGRTTVYGDTGAFGVNPLVDLLGNPLGPSGRGPGDGRSQANFVFGRSWMTPFT